MWQKFFRLLYPRQKPPEFEFWRHMTYSKKILTKNHVKLSANESLHCTDYKMVCDRSFFGCFTPGRSPRVWIMTMEKTLTKNRMELSAKKSLHCTDYENGMWQKLFRLLYPWQKPPIELWRRSEKFWQRIAWKLVQTKAYIATKWYVTEFFSVALSPPEAPKFDIWRHSELWRHNSNFGSFCRG